MTKHELLLMSAYTGFLFCQMDELHKFTEGTIGRPVFTHELAGDKVQRELHEKLLPEINKIIEEAQQ